MRTSPQSLLCAPHQKLEEKTLRLCGTLEDFESLCVTDLTRKA
jgi:hypothetical protein